MKVEKVDPETLKVKYRVGTSRQNWNSKMGISDVDECNRNGNSARFI